MRCLVHVIWSVRVVVTGQMDANFTFTGGFSTPAVAAVLAIETVAGLIANAIVLSVTLYQRKSWKQPSTIFFTSLILAQLLLLLVHPSLSAIAIGTEEWIFGSSDEVRNVTCLFAAYTFWYCLMVITMTLDVISFDRFLFIVKPHLHKRFMRPWVALIVTVTIWILAAFLNSTPFYGLGIFRYEDWLGSCFPVWIRIDYIVYTLVLIFLLLSVITVMSVWTFCFTHRFISKLYKSNVYMSKNKRLFGVFGAMLLVYGLCFTPGIVAIFLVLFIEVPGELFVTSYICIMFIAVANPIVQSYFRPEFKKTLLCRKQASPGIKEKQSQSFIA